MKAYIILLFIGLLYINPMNAQVETRSINSYKLGEPRSYRIYIPEDYDEDKKYPLLVVLDGDYLFDLTVANVKFFRHKDEMPPAIVLGINQEETRDEDIWHDPATGFPDKTGAAFFEFLGMELVAQIEKQYSISSFKGIIGHGKTANFINYYLFKDNPLFNAYIALSPTLAVPMAEYLTDRLRTLEQPVFYYLSTSKNDTKENRESIEGLHYGLSGISKETLHYWFDRADFADHHAVASYTLPEALDQIFDTYTPISVREYREKLMNYVGNPIDYLTDKYRSIADQYGVEKTTTLNDFMAIYAISKKKDDTHSIEELSKLAKKQYPDTMLGFFLEAEALELSGEPKKAMRTYEKAFSLEEIDFITKDLALERIDQIKQDFGW